jgi:hypothetical protein
MVLVPVTLRLAMAEDLVPHIASTSIPLQAYTGLRLAHWLQKAARISSIWQVTVSRRLACPWRPTQHLMAPPVLVRV